MTRAFVIGRRRPGRKIGQAIRQAGRRLEAGGWKVESALVRRKRELRAQSAAAVKDGFDVVVAVGGDGTVLRVVNGIAETEVVLGIVPMGTGNLLAGNLGIPKDLDSAVAALLVGARRRIDLGLATIGGKERHFAVACGIGFDARVMEKVDAASKRRLGRLAYALEAVRQAGEVHDVEVQLVIDGARTSATAAQVFVANFGRLGPGLAPRREVVPDDGLLDVFVIEAPGPVRGLLAGLEALGQPNLGRSAAGHAFRARAREVRVETRPALPVELDGSALGSAPVTVSVRPGALTVIAPPSDDDARRDEAAPSRPTAPGGAAPTADDDRPQRE